MFGSQSSEQAFEFGPLSLNAEVFFWMFFTFSEVAVLWKESESTDVFMH